MKKSKLTLVREKVKKEVGKGWLNEYLCECGNKTLQRPYTVNTMVVISCGCAHIRNVIPSYSLLTLVKADVKRVKQKIYDEYLCKCGNTAIRIGVLVRNGSTKSCGCLKLAIGDKNRKYHTPPSDSKLTFIRDLKSNHRGSLAEYKCECGIIKPFNKSSVNSGSVRSCGCLQKGAVKHGHASHKKVTRVYRIWIGMRRRCRNRPGYIDRGIKVCKEWASNFMNFYEWSMKNGYSDDLQIDRIKNNSGYRPSNCRWTTGKINSNNRRSSLGVEKIKKIKRMLADGYTSYEISEKLGFVSASHVRSISRGVCHSDITI